MAIVPRARHGISLIETLAAVLIVGIVAAGAVATWGLSSRVSANKRATEMANYLGPREIERLKARKFANLPISAVDGSGNAIATVTYYDKTGASSNTAVSLGYMVKSTVTTAVSRGASSSSADLREIQVQVWSSDGAKRYDDGNIRTLMASGGM